MKVTVIKMDKIPLGVIEEIKERNDIVELAGRYTTLKRRGSTYTGLCPFHSEKTPSFTVYPSNGSFYCFGCGVGGDMISFVMRAENLTYPEALSALADRAGVNLSAYSRDGDEERYVSRKRIFEMNKDAARFYRDRLFDEREGAAAREYLTSRGLSQEVIKRFGLGYAPGGSRLFSHLRSLGYKSEEMTAGFLCREYGEGGNKRIRDLFFNRVMFPIINTSGNVIAFGGRVMNNEGSPKYLNSSDTPAFKKSSNLYALNFAKDSSAESLILCEGYMDVIALHASGISNAVATLGTALTQEQARIIAKYTKRVIINYDSDEAGQRAASRAIGLLEDVGLDVRVLKLKGAKDPDEYIKKFGVDSFRDALDESSTKFSYVASKIMSEYDMESESDRISAAKRMNEYIAGVSSSVEREIYIHQASELTGISEESIKSDISLIIKKKAASKKKSDREKLILDSSGYGDRINRDKLKTLRAASCEEALLGIMLAFPEYIRSAAEGADGAPTREDFKTEFGGRVFEKLVEVYKENGFFDLSALTPDFSLDEMSRLTKLMQGRDGLDNSESVFADMTAALRRENERVSAKNMDAIDAIMRLRRKNTGDDPKHTEG